MRTINWDRLANCFADHDLAMQRMKESFLRQHRKEIEYAESWADNVIYNIPDLVSDQLETCRRENQPPKEWVLIWAWSDTTPFDKDSGLAVTTTIECRLGAENIRTKHETGKDQTYELHANVDDLRKVALEQCKRPRVEINVRPSTKK